MAETGNKENKTGNGKGQEDKIKGPQAFQDFCRDV
jgi:hypothetical protein